MTEDHVDANATASTSSDGQGAVETSGMRKQVQVIGEPPPYHAPVRENGKATDNQSSGQRSDDEEDQDEEVDAGESEEADAADGESVDDAEILEAFQDDEEAIDLTHLRLTYKSIHKMPFHRFKKLQRLCLRQNQISKFTSKDIGSLGELFDLDLYDNALEKTYGEALRGCPQLESLDYSFNSIHKISHLTHLANLRTLYFVQNKISRVRSDDFAQPLGASLRSLELGGNRLRSLENLEELTQLEELWVGKNKIAKLEGVSHMQNLRVLSIQSNRITKLENLDDLRNLEELYISHNGLEHIEGLRNNTKLTTLDVGGNRISAIENVSHLVNLEEFWANDNQINILNDLEQELGVHKCPALRTVYLEGNPGQRKEGANYRRKVRLALPQIRQIDATFVQ